MRHSAQETIAKFRAIRRLAGLGVTPEQLSRSMFSTAFSSIVKYSLNHLGKWSIDPSQRHSGYQNCASGGFYGGDEDISWNFQGHGPYCRASNEISSEESSLAAAATDQQWTPSWFYYWADPAGNCICSLSFSKESAEFHVKDWKLILQPTVTMLPVWGKSYLFLALWPWAA